MGKRAIGLLMAALAAALFVLGCGDSTSISKAEFTKKAEAVCKKGEAALRKDFNAYIKKHEKNLSNPTQAKLAEFVDVAIISNIESEVKALRAIDEPSGDGDQVEAFIDAREESIKKAEAEPKEAITDSEKIFGESSKLAKQYGLDTCSER